MLNVILKAVRCRAAPLSALMLFCAGVMPSHAGGVEIVAVDVVRSGDGYRFDVTLRHADTGWDHYANEWQVLGPDGVVLGTRTLYHPHVNEQPFTRSLSGVVIDPALDEVQVHARDSIHGYSDPVTVPLRR